jgi:hypothetical protein
VSLPDNNSGTFNIFASSNIKTFVVPEIDKVSSFIFEELPPSGVGAPDLHVVRFSRALDIEGLVVVLGLDSQ